MGMNTMSGFVVGHYSSKREFAGIPARAAAPPDFTGSPGQRGAFEPDAAIPAGVAKELQPA
jgi:hypothetical protein